MELSVFKESKIRIVRNITVTVEDPLFNEPSNVTHNVTDLSPFTDYFFEVAAINDAGVGPFTYASFETNPDCEHITLIRVCLHCNCKNGKLNYKMAPPFPFTYPSSSWSSVKLVLSDNVDHFSKDNVE